MSFQKDIKSHVFLKSEKNIKYVFPNTAGGRLSGEQVSGGRMLYQVWVGRPVLDRYWTVGLQLIYSTGPVRSTRRWTVRSLITSVLPLVGVIIDVIHLHSAMITDVIKLSVFDKGSHNS